MSSRRAHRCWRKVHGRWEPKVGFAGADQAEAWAAKATTTVYGWPMGAYE